MRFWVASLLALALCGCGASVNGGYTVDDGRVIFHHGFASGMVTVAEADVRTFKALNREYGRDRNHVFLREQIVAGADPRTFQVIQSAYSKDKAHGYYDGKAISNDPAHFVLIVDPEDTGQDRVGYAKDSTRVYRHDLAIEGADPATFVWVPMANGDYLTHDKLHVWETGYSVPLEDADGASFQKLSVTYFRDRRNVWGRGNVKTSEWRFGKIPLADFATFTAVGEFFGKDKSRAFYENRVIEGADPGTFVATGSVFAKDKTRVYQYNNVVKGADPATFKSPGG